MQLEIITTDAGFAALRDDWNRLAAADPLNGWEWNHAWWQEFRRAGRLAIGVVRDGVAGKRGEITAIAPLYSVRRSLQGHVLQFLGSGKACTDYRRILLGSTTDQNRIARVVGALLDAAAWKQSGFGPVDLWELEGIDVEEPSMQVLVAGLRSLGYSIAHDALESTWATTLPESWEAFVASTHRTIRRKIHKARRRAEDPEIGFHTASDPTEIADAWAQFVRLHQCRFQEKVVGGGCFTDPTFERFLKSAVETLAAQGKVRLLWCSYRGAPISIQLYLLGGDTAYMYQSGFDPQYSQLEPGHLLYSFTVAYLIATGFTKLDFLRGDESYKADWNGRPNPLARVRCVSPRITSRLRDRLFLAARAAKRIAGEFRSRTGKPQPTHNHRSPQSAPGATAAPHEQQELVEV